MSIRPSLYRTQEFPVLPHARGKTLKSDALGKRKYPQICRDIPSVPYRLLEQIRYREWVLMCRAHSVAGRRKSQNKTVLVLGFPVGRSAESALVNPFSRAIA